MRAAVGFGIEFDKLPQVAMEMLFLARRYRQLDCVIIDRISTVSV